MKRIPIHRFLLWVGLFLVVVGAKLWCVSIAGSSVPYRDQIDAEGEKIIRPWVEDRLETAAFFEPHNEHRVVFTKLIAWGVVILNGQWDAYVQVTLNAALHAVLLIIVLVWLWEHLRGWHFALIATVGVLLWVLPLDWENTLQGFQSQIYLMLLFSFLHILGVLTSESRSWKWVVGHVSGVCALFAMAGGMLSSVAVLIVVVMRGWIQSGIGPRSRVDLILSTLMVLVGLLIRTEVPAHAWLRAQNLSEFFGALGAVMAWPIRDLQPWSVMFGLPALIAGYFLARKKQLGKFELSYLAVVVWLFLIVFATAAFRGHGSPLISRYLSNYTLLAIAQGVALTFLPRARLADGALAFWGAGIIISLLGTFSPVMEGRIEPRDALVDRQESIVRSFLATNDAAVVRQAPTADLIYPSAEVLIERWSHSSIRQVLPAAVRRPIEIANTPAVPVDSLPPSPRGAMVASPQNRQVESWVWESPRQSDEASRFLRFKINGALGDPEAALSMKLVSDTESVDVIPDGAARNRWKTINVWRPAGEWWIEIEDNDSLEHIAISAPVELGPVSWATEKLIKYHLWWISLGTALLLAGASLTFAQKTRRSPNSA